MNKNLFYVKKSFQLNKDDGGSRGLFRGDLVELSADEAQEAVQSGHLIRINDSLYQEYDSKLEDNFTKAQDKIEAIRNSDDPIYAVEGKSKFDIKAIEEEREKQDQLLRAEYDKKLDELKAQIEKQQALTVDVNSPADKDAAAHKVEVFKFEANTESLDVAINNLNKFTEYADDEAVRAIMPFIGEINAVIDDKEADKAKASLYKTQVVEAIKDAQEIDLVKAFDQYPTSGQLATNANMKKIIEERRGNQQTKRTHITL